MNPFSLLSLPETYDINLTLLEQHYLEAQKAFHPDKWARETDAARRMAAHKAADMNAAYHLLKDPVARARYFLEQQGVMKKGEETISDPELLEEIFDLQENPPAADTYQQMLDETELGLINAFESQDYVKARHLTLRLGYLIKM